MDPPEDATLELEKPCEPGMPGSEGMPGMLGNVVGVVLNRTFTMAPLAERQP
jgi:hypothetical protein